MKRHLTVAALAALLATACNTSQLAVSSDDVYAIPAEEQALARKQAEEKARREALAREEAAQATEQKNEKESLAKKAEDENNVYYKDPSYSRDDYYDYEYAARLNRFHNPIGVGYYDSYYTNMYFYNHNPAFYGTSIYSTYNWWMPSAQFSNISIGISSGWGYGGWGNCYASPYYPFYTDPWCSPYGYGYGYGAGWGYGGYGGYWGSPSWSYMNGYNNGYWNGYNNGWNNARWGYYNSYDVNSNYKQAEFAPRGNNTGGNSRVRTNPGMQVGDDGIRNRYVESVAEQQNNRQRFTNTGRQRVMRNAEPGQNSNQSRQPIINNSPSPGSVGNSNSGRERPRSEERRNSNRVYSQPREDNSRQNQNRGSNSNQGNNNTWNQGSSPSNSGGGGSAPRNSGGGGTRRPR